MFVGVQEGRPYYFNVITNQTRWSFPSPPQPPQQPQQPPQQPPQFVFGGPPQPPHPFVFGVPNLPQPPQPQPPFAFGGFGQPQPPPPQPPQPPNGGFAFGGLQHDTWEFAPNPLNLHENVRDTR